MQTSKVGSAQTVDRGALEGQVKAMYTRVAREPEGDFHFEMGRRLAERLGYPPADLDRIPAESVASFAGVGYFFHLADLRPRESVVDLGSGSGTDTFIAALAVGPQGRVVGIDMTDAQRHKAERLRDAGGFSQVGYRKGYIEKLPVNDQIVDVVISNGVINLSPDKAAVFREAARILKPGGRLALADIVTESRLPQSVTCNADLWAACIGGAIEEEEYCAQIEAAGLRVTRVERNDAYGFISENARSASHRWGVKSISLHAVKATA